MQKRGTQPTQSAVNSFFKKKSPTPTTPTTPIVVSEVINNPTSASTTPAQPPSAVKRCGKYDSLEKKIKIPK